ncbi:fimbrial protein, partial [Metapseudomonas sp. CR1201]
MNIKLKFLLVVAVLVAAGEVRAYECNTVTSFSNISVPQLTVQRDLPLDAEIARVESGVVSTYKCTGSDITWQEFGIKGYGTYVKNIAGKRIYASGIDGIGYAVGVTMPSVPECSGGPGWVGEVNTTGNPDNRLKCQINGFFGTQPMQGKAFIVFYKTAETTGSGEVASKNVASFILRTNKSSWHYPESRINIGFKVNTVSCSLRDAWIEVDMDKVGSHLFGGVGTWPGDNNTKPFSIPLSCAAGAKVNLKIDGNVQNASQGVLKLDA